MNLDLTPESRIFADNPHLAHDLSALRRLTLAHALRESEADEALLEPAFEAFYAARNQVECYPDSLDALQRLAARLPVAALSLSRGGAVALRACRCRRVPWHWATWWH